MKARMTLLAVVVTGVSAYIALRNVDFEDVWETLRSSEYWWLLPALAVMAVAVFLRAIRWRYLYVRETRPAVWPCTEALLVGHFFNTVLPMRAGDVARVGAINIRTGCSRAEALATIVVERAFDVFALLLLLFLALPWLPQVTWVRTAALIAVILALGLAACVVTLALYGERPLHFVFRPLSRLPFLSARRVEVGVVNLAKGLAGLRRAHLGGVSFVLTIVSWILLAFSFWLVTLCFDLDLPFGAGLLVVIATGFSLVIPAAPAGIGVFEAATVVALAAYDVPKADALSYALVLHLLNIVPFLVAGAIVLNLHGFRGLGRGGVRSAAVAGGPGVHEYDVAEPADGNADVRDP